ncbi:MAG: hypothetical protein WCD16_16775 [Paracoccaceae bacterium]
MPRLIAALMTAALLAACAPLRDGAPPSFYFAENQQKVLPDPSDPAAFEVFPYAGAGPRDYWCAAGEYVMRGLHRDPGTRVYLLAPLGESVRAPGRQSIRFTVAPDAELLRRAENLPEGGYGLSLTRIGENWRAIHVGRDCEREILVPPFP